MILNQSRWDMLLGFVMQVHIRLYISAACLRKICKQICIFWSKLQRWQAMITYISNNMVNYEILIGAFGFIRSSFSSKGFFCNKFSMMKSLSYFVAYPCGGISFHINTTLHYSWLLNYPFQSWLRCFANSLSEHLP